MLLYKAFFKIVKKNLPMILMYVSIILMITLISKVSLEKSAEERRALKYDIIVENKDDSEISKELCTYLSKIHNVTDKKLTRDQIKEKIFYEEILSYIVIPKGFGDSFETDGDLKPESLYDENMPVGMSVNMQINTWLNSVKNYQKLGLSLKESVEKCDETLNPDSYVHLETSKKNEKSLTESVFNYLPYGILSAILLSILPVFSSFNEEKKNQRILAAGLPATKRNLYFALASISLAMILLIVFDAIGSIAGGPEIMFTKTWWFVILNTLCYVICASLLALMISNIFNLNNTGVSIVTNIVGLGFSFLGGTFVPLEYLGDEAKIIGKFTPNYWYSTANDYIFQGKNMSNILLCFGLQLIIGVALFCVGLTVAKVRKKA